MANLVVDTDVVSFGFRQDTRFVNDYGPSIQGHDCIVSFMTIAELNLWQASRQWGDRRRDGLAKYLNQHYFEYGVSSELCRMWGELVWSAKRVGRVLLPGDAWIAATAVVLDVPLVTHNKKDFDYLPTLKLISFPDKQ